MDCSTPGSSVHGILQARVLEQPVKGYSNLLFGVFSFGKEIKETKMKDNTFVTLKELPFGKPVPAISHNHTPDGSVQLAKRNLDTVV